MLPWPRSGDPLCGSDFGAGALWRQTCGRATCAERCLSPLSVISATRKSMNIVLDGSAAAASHLIPCSWSPAFAGMTEERSVLDGDDHLVRADEAELAADHLVGEVGIGAARVEQSGAVLEAGAVGVERGQLDQLFLLLPAIIAPAQDAVRTDDRVAEEVGDDQQSERGQRRLPDNL